MVHVLKNPKNIPKLSVKNFFKKIILHPKFSENLDFWLFLVKNSINPVSLQNSINLGMHAITQNDYNTIL